MKLGAMDTALYLNLRYSEQRYNEVGVYVYLELLDRLLEVCC